MFFVAIGDVCDLCKFSLCDVLFSSVSNIREHNARTKHCLFYNLRRYSDLGKNTKDIIAEEECHRVIARM